MLHRWWVMYLLLRGGAKGCSTTGGSCTCSSVEELKGAPPLEGHVPAPPWWVMYLLHQSLLHLRVYFTSSTKCGGSHTCSTSLWWIIDLLHQSMVDHRPGPSTLLHLASAPPTVSKPTVSNSSGFSWVHCALDVCLVNTSHNTNLDQFTRTKIEREMYRHCSYWTKGR